MATTATRTDYDPSADPDYPELHPLSTPFRVMPWPDAVPVLVAGDVAATEQADRKPLWLWLSEAFPNVWCRTVAHEYLLRVLDAVRGRWGSLFDHHEALANQVMADGWNEAMGRLGYDVPRKRRARPTPAGPEYSPPPKTSKGKAKAEPVAADDDEEDEDQPRRRRKSSLGDTSGLFGL